MADGATDKTHSTLIPPPGQEGAALKDGVIPQAAGVPSEFARRAETLQQINLFIRTRWWVVVACLVPAGSADPQALADGVTTFCRDRLARYKVPERLLVVDSLPRNAMGKVVKAELVPRFDGS